MHACKLVYYDGDGAGGDDGDDDVHLEGEAGVDLLELAFARILDVEFDLLPSWFAFISLIANNLANHDLLIAKILCYLCQRIIKVTIPEINGGSSDFACAAPPSHKVGGWWWWERDWVIFDGDDDDDDDDEWVVVDDDDTEDTD